MKRMKLKIYQEEKDNVKFPVIVQRKMDGHWCRAKCTAKLNLIDDQPESNIYYKEKEVRLYSSGGIEIQTMDHITSQLANCMPIGAEWDGELYIHGMKFNELTSLIKKKQEGSELVNYIVYDSVDEDTYSFRKPYIDDDNLDNIKDYYAFSHSDIEELQQTFLNEGYEGAVIRQHSCGYEDKKSDSVLKFKPVFDSEFEIIGYTEGKGKLVGHIGTFIMKTNEGIEIKAKLSTTEAHLKELFENPDFIGKMMTVEYKGVNDSGKLREPVAKAIREKGDM